MTKQELVVLVDENNNIIGTAPKAMVHTQNTPLHRAFSCFVFRSNGTMLLQQRSSKKITWPLIWSNACCGHPAPNETNIEAVSRRLQQELGMNISTDVIYEVLPDFQYKATMLGVMENEICPVFVVFSDDPIQINPEEVESIKEVKWASFIASLMNKKDKTYDALSVWCREESALLHVNDRFKILWNEHILRHKTI